MQEVLKELALGSITLGTAVIIALVKAGLSYAKGWILAKTNKTVYENALGVAKGLYYVLEEQYDSGATKKKMMDTKLLELFPNLTKAELDAINKQVCNQIKNAIRQEVLTDDK